MACLLTLAVSTNSCVYGQKDVSKEIQAQNDLITAAFGRADLETLSGYYVDETTIFPPNGEPIRGLDALSGFWQAALSMGLESIKFTTTSAIQSGNLVVEEGTYSMYAPGKILADAGKYIVCWKKTGNKWVITKDIWNSSLPPAPVTSIGDTVCLVSMKFRETDLENQLKFSDLWLDISNEYYPETHLRGRNYVDLKADKQGNINVYFLLSPYHPSTDNIDMFEILKLRYPEEEARTLLDSFMEKVLEHHVFYITPLN